MLFQNLSIVDIRSRLSEIKFNVVSEHLEDDPDELAGTVPEGIVMSPALRHLGIIVYNEKIFVDNLPACHRIAFGYITLLESEVALYVSEHIPDGSTDL